MAITEVTTRVNVQELASVNRALDDIARQLGASTNPRVRAAVKELAKLSSRIDEATRLSKKHAQVVCLCGSTRFWKKFQEVSLEQTLEGKIVLSVGAAVASDDEHFGHLPEKEKADIKARLDVLHLRKIDLADYVYIINVDGYVGASTQAELNYAWGLGKPILFLEEPFEIIPEQKPDGRWNVILIYPEKEPEPEQAELALAAAGEPAGE